MAQDKPISHTPGPWRINSQRHSEIKAGPDNKLWTDGPDKFANAALAAVAPEMLDLLEKIERLATELGAKGYPLNAMRLVIAKAKGRI